MKNLNELIALTKLSGARRLVVAAAADLFVLQAVQSAMKEEIINPILIGGKNQIISLSESIGLDLKSITIIDIPDPFLASVKGVEIIKEGKGEILMKGMVGTTPFLKAILDKDKGLLKTGLLSHLALCEMSFYHKIIGITDVAINIAPNLAEKITLIKNCLPVFHRLGYENPKIAVICPVETVNEKIESTVHASLLTMMHSRKQITNCIIEGPLSLDIALSMEAAEHKGITSQVAGDADLLLVPDLNSGNILYKSLVTIRHANSAAIVTGANVPIVLTSRADSKESKLLSIALAAIS